MTAATSGERVAVDPALQAMVDAALELAPPPLPTPWPAAGQPREEWVVEVAARRAAHIAFGRRHREQVADDAPSSSAPPATAPEVASVEVRDIPVAAATIRAWVYTPHGDGPFPALVLFHGGGFWIGGEDAGMGEADPGCRVLSSQLGAVVVNVDYRQAPEHKFPGPLEDCYAATAWVAANAAALGVDPDRITIGGPSAGGNLTAGVARLARDRSGPPVRLQLLMVPTTDATLALSSASAVGMGFDLTSDGVADSWRMYLAPDADRTDPLLSPLVASDLAGLPPAHVVVAELDPLRDEGAAYAQRLAEAGVPTTLSEFHMTHSFATPGVAAAYLADVIGAVRRAVAPRA